MNLTPCHCAPFHVPKIYFLGSGGKQVKGDGEHAGRAEFQLVLLNSVSGPLLWKLEHNTHELSTALNH